MPRDRRRRSRDRGTRPPEGPAANPVASRMRVTPAREWRWRTFPVYFTFAATFFVTIVVTGLLAGKGLLTALFPLLLLPASLLLAIGLSHFVSVGFVAPRLKRRQSR